MLKEEGVGAQDPFLWLVNGLSENSAICEKIKKAQAPRLRNLQQPCAGKHPRQP